MRRETAFPPQFILIQDNEEFAERVAEKLFDKMRSEREQFIKREKEKREERLNEKALAKRLGRCRQTIRNYVKQNKIRSHMVGGRRIFLWTEVSEDLFGK